MDDFVLDKTLEKQIKEYCEMNGINDINGFIVRCLKQGFNIIRYGVSPMDNIVRQNKGINDFKDEEKTDDTRGKDSGKQEEPKVEEHKPSEEKEVKPIKEKKPVRVRKIQVIKKD